MEAESSLGGPIQALNGLSSSDERCSAVMQFRNEKVSGPRAPKRKDRAKEGLEDSIERAIVPAQLWETAKFFKLIRSVM
jgi:hypothetical protein